MDIMKETESRRQYCNFLASCYRGKSNLEENIQQKSREKEMTKQSGLQKIRRQGGYVMVSAMALMLVLLGVGIAFMQWASDESVQSQHNIAGMQAYYVAQAGVIEQGLHWLRTQQAGLLPQSEIHLNGGEVRVDREVVGEYSDVKVGPVLAGTQGSDIFFATTKFRISAEGSVLVPWYKDGRKEEVPIVRKAILYVSVRSFADYLYLTDHEVDPFGDPVRFFRTDSLFGRVHSNDTIRCMQGNTYFEGLTTTSGIVEGREFPDFAGGLLEHVPKIVIPTVAQTVRDGAAAQGLTDFSRPDMEYRLHFQGAIAYMYYWEAGAPFDSMTAHRTTISGGVQTCICVERPLSILGEVAGRWTVGCSEDIYLIDDVKYSCLDIGHDYSIPADCNDYCGIVSEKRVVIANTWANGRENRAQDSDIVITAAIVALGEEGGIFTFDQQNDVWDTYIGPNPDERGAIHLRGSVTQRFRGYVHRSNNGGTGYDKDYDYDDRFRYNRPACFIDATDASGRALFDFMQWGQAVENPQDIRNDIRVRYN